MYYKLSQYFIQIALAERSLKAAAQAVEQLIRQLARAGCTEVKVFKSALELDTQIPIKSNVWGIYLLFLLLRSSSLPHVFSQS